MARCKAPDVFSRERIYASPSVIFAAVNLPALDTGKDEGDDADGRFSAAC